jgi:hypothetical protein
VVRVHGGVRVVQQRHLCSIFLLVLVYLEEVLLGVEHQERVADVSGAMEQRC